MIELRGVTDADLPVLFEQQLDPEAVAMAAFPSRNREDFLAHWGKILADDSVTARVIVADGQVAGDIVSWQASDAERLVGYWLGREFWGRGIASQALDTFVEVDRSRPLHARVATHNVASLRVLEKCGFEILGEEPGSLEGDDDLVELVLVLRDEVGPVVT